MEITAVKGAKLSCLAYSTFPFAFTFKHPASQKFHEDKEVINEVTTWLHAHVAVFYDLRTQKLVSRLNKHHATSGDYVEK